jgi:hypothetical protein
METTHAEIVDFWARAKDECGLAVDWAEAHTLCWRCAHKRQLQRCHIVPRALGGSEDASNLVLLCKQCHAEAPNVADASFMWTWLRAHAVAIYGMYWYERGLREYEFIFKRKPLEGIVDDEALRGKLNAAIATYIQKTSTHWGQGKINPATIAWLIRKVEADATSDA